MKESPRHEVPEIEVKERANNFVEVATGYEDEDATHECDRCLSCGCFAATDCLLRKYATEYDVEITKFSGYIRKPRVDDRHPYLIYDPNKCILCTRCIRTCTKVLGTPALGLVHRGFKTEMRPAMNDPLTQTNCVSCGNCIDACPTGALTPKLPFAGRCDLTMEKEESVCGFCSLGCEVEVNKYSDDRYFLESPATGKYLCRFGRFGSEMYIRKSRIKTPLLRKEGRLVESKWEETYDHIVKSMQKQDPETVAVFISPELTNEELFLANRIAREALKTNNIASISLLDFGEDFHKLDKSFGFTGSTADRQVLQEADVIICNNTDPENDNLILSMDIIKAVQNGAKLIVCASANSSLTKMAEVVLDPIRGRSALLWNGVIQHLIEEKFFDRDKIKAMDGGEDFLADEFDYSLEKFGKTNGSRARKIQTSGSIGTKRQKYRFCPQSRSFP